MPSFMIHRIEYLASALNAVGRCGDESITIGTRFHCARRRSPGKPESQVSLELTVLAIDTYGRELQTLEPGLAGRIQLSGEGLDLLESGDTLAAT